MWCDLLMCLIRIQDCKTTEPHLPMLNKHHVRFGFFQCHLDNLKYYGYISSNFLSSMPTRISGVCDLSQKSTCACSCLIISTWPDSAHLVVYFAVVGITLTSWFRQHPLPVALDYYVKYVLIFDKFVPFTSFPSIFSCYIDSLMFLLGQVHYRSINAYTQ